jgi:Tol biopolymer transport system component
MAPTLGAVRRLLVVGLFFALAVPASAGRLPIIAAQDWWPTWSPSGEDIAFTRISGRTMTLDVVDLATHRTARIAANQGQLAPSWSSDGRLAFSLGGKIYTANADGSGRAPMTSQGHAYAPAWRPGSSDIAYLTTVGARNTDLWVNGTLWARDAIGIPAWSPDGTQLAFERVDGVYVTTAPGAERRVASVANPFAPAWSPDGTRIAYVAARRVWVVPADESAPPRAVSARFAILSTPSWSRQGNDLAYAGSESIRLWHADTGKTSRLGDAAAGVAFSPVADTLAFSGPRPTCPGHVSIRVYHDRTANGPVSGSCEIAGTPGNDVIDGTGAGGDIIIAGNGNDTVLARNGHRDTVDCGPGRDSVWADRSDTLRGCEIVHVR